MAAKLNSKFYLILPLVIFALIQSSSSATDLTLKERATGADVVEAVIDRIYGTDPLHFDDDYDILKRIAWAESRFGNDSDTFRVNFTGGIWQMNERKYELTKNLNLYPALNVTHQNISSAFQINWLNTTWSDLLKPLYSGLAARLFLSTINEPIPQTLEGQAKYWNDYYNNADALNETHFIEEVTEYENSTKCNGKMDLLVVLDESGSVNLTNFKLALQFVGSLFNSYSLDNVRMGFMTFSYNPTFHFRLDNTLSK